MNKYLLMLIDCNTNIIYQFEYEAKRVKTSNQLWNMVYEERKNGYKNLSRKTVFDVSINVETRPSVWDLDKAESKYKRINYLYQL